MNRRILPLIAALGLALIPTANAAQITPTPRAVAVPVTATNRPFLGARTALQPVDLAPRGYVEEEFFVSGNANIYDWSAPGAKSPVTLRTARVPYATRLLVRRPQDPGRASGRVIVELLEASGAYDTAPLWGYSWEHFLRHGDIWVGLTVRPAAVETLKRFDPVRYAPLSFAYAQAADCQDAGNAQSEEGLAWDVTAQVGALLRSSTKENPLAGFDVRRLVVAGYAQAGGELVTYLNAVHDALRLGNDLPVYDAYVEADGAMAPAPINQCAAALAAGDARRRVSHRDAPVVTVMTQTDFARALDVRRQDSDAPEDYFRLYEIAGAAHSGPFPAGQPAVMDLKIAGLPGPDSAEACVEPASTFPAGYAFNGLWMQLEDYLLRSVPLQHAAPIGVGEQGKVVLDAKGNAVGGLRLPQLSVPLATYAGRSTPREANPRSEERCGRTGAMRRYDAAELKALYGSRAGYLKRFNEAVDAALADRWLEPADAAALKAQAPRTTPAF